MLPLLSNPSDNRCHSEVAKEEYGAGAGEQPARIEDDVPTDPSLIYFSDNLVRGNLCAFIQGYLYFLAEAEVTAKSIAHFMPGMRIVVTAHPAHVDTFNR